MSAFRKTIMAAAVLFMFRADARDQRTELLPQEQVEQACRQYLLEQTGYAEEKVLCSLRKPFPEIALPEGQLDLEVSGQVDKDALGRVPLKVEVLVNGAPVTMIYPVFDLDIKTRAFITTRWIKRGEDLSGAEVLAVDTARTTLPPRAVTEAEQFQGLIARVSIPKGRILALNHVEEPPLVKKKQPVTIVYVKGSLKIEARGLALMDGRQGAVIKVRNQDSGKTIFCEVTGEDLVAVKSP